MMFLISRLQSCCVPRFILAPIFDDHLPPPIGLEEGDTCQDFLVHYISHFHVNCCRVHVLSVHTFSGDQTHNSDITPPQKKYFNVHTQPQRDAVYVYCQCIVLPLSHMYRSCFSD